MAFVKLRSKMNLFLTISLLVVSVQSYSVDNQKSAVALTQNDDIWSTLENIRDFSIPNFSGCEQTKACYLDLLTSIGYSTFPTYADFQAKMTTSYSSGQSLKNFCGTFDAVSRCFSAELDSCITPTVFNAIFNISNDEAYRFSTDVELRKIMCDNQDALSDPCLLSVPPVKMSTPIENDADATCDLVASDFSAAMAESAAAGCSDAVTAVKCEVDAKTKAIETLGVCDGKMPLCPSDFHSCDATKECFDTFYNGIEAAGIKSPIPDYENYAKNMKNKFEKADTIGNMCRLQASLHACLIRHIDTNCPINAASFRSMYGMNYEQAYDYSTDFNLRKQQCIYMDGITNEGKCLTLAQPLLKVCNPEIPHTLSQGKACTDLRLAMKCNIFAVRQTCPEETRKMYCVTQGIIYQQDALGFCDGWMPDCEPFDPTPTPSKTKGTTMSSDGPPSSTQKTARTEPTTTSVPTTTTVMTTSNPSSVTAVPPTTPTTSMASISIPILSALILSLRLTL